MSLTQEQITPELLKRLFPNATQSTYSRNQQTKPATETAVRPAAESAPVGDKVPGAIAEPALGKVVHGEISAESGDTARHLVRIESRRCRLLDEDNLFGGCKPFIDALRHAFAIPNDTPNQIKLQVFQTKVSTLQEEETILEVYPPGSWEKLDIPKLLEVGTQ